MRTYEEDIFLRTYDVFKRGTQIGDRERVVELRSAEPPYETREHLDNG